MGNKTSDKKASHTEFVEFFSDILIDPLFFAFTVFILFERIYAIINLTEANPEYSFWAVLEVDMHLNLWVYVLFLVVFGLWAILKGIKHRREKAEKEELNNTLNGLHKAIEDLPDKIAEAIMPLKGGDSKSK
jgi:flagellar biosynthesis protein FlhB